MSGISSILSIRGGGRPSPDRAYIIPLDVYKDDKPVNDQKRYFQYFPESVNVTKQVNWQTKEIPGLSHPLYQWISGGAREITFTSVFTRDRELTIGEKRALGSMFVTKGDVTLLSGGEERKTLADPRNVDIPSAIAWLTSFQLPNYAANHDATRSFDPSRHRPKPPSKLILGLPGLRLGMGSRSGHSADELVCVMLSADVTYESFFSDGTPRIARVALSFAETIQVRNKVGFSEAGALRNAGMVGYRLQHSSQDKKR